jgi:hypothetical protein
MGSANSKIISIIKKHEGLLNDVMNQEVEYGGIIDLDSKKMHVTTKGDGKSVVAIFSSDPKFIYWHAHPYFGHDADDNTPCQGCYPSNQDMMASLRSSLAFEHDIINIVFTPKGIFVYKPSKKMLKIFHRRPKDKAYLMNIVERNLELAYDATDEEYLASKKFNKPVKVFITEMKNILGTGLGYEIDFYPFKGA